MKAEIILKYKLEDNTPDYREVVDVTCPTELENLAYATLALTKNGPNCIPATMVNFNILTEEK